MFYKTKILCLSFCVYSYKCSIHLIKQLVFHYDLTVFDPLFEICEEIKVAMGQICELGGW